LFKTAVSAPLQKKQCLSTGVAAVSSTVYSNSIQASAATYGSPSLAPSTLDPNISLFAQIYKTVVSSQLTPVAAPVVNSITVSTVSPMI